MAYIKDSVIGCFKKQLCELEHNPDKFSRAKAKFLKNYVIVTLEASKTDDVVEVEHGEWKLHPDGSGTCSCCNRTQKFVWDYDNAQNFCGHCGAKNVGNFDRFKKE